MNTISERGSVDSSVVVGVIVVLAIVGAVAYGVYYYGFVQTEREELQDAKNSAKTTLAKTLANVDTPQARTATRNYLAQINASDSKSEISSIVNKISNTYEVEKKRVELLKKVENATHGSFYTLNDLNESLRSQVNSATSINGLTAIEVKIDSSATSTWKNKHLSQIGSVADNNVVMIGEDSPIYEAHYTEDNARLFVQDKSWRVLKQVKFVSPSSFLVPIIDTFDRTLTIEVGSRVDIYEYNQENQKMTRRVQNAEVLSIVYPKDTLSSISWSSSEDGRTHSYSTNIWEEIKAQKAGADYANEEWNEWAKSVIETARDDANIGDYDLKVIYVFSITNDEVAKTVTNIEHQQQNKDAVLIARK